MDLHALEHYRSYSDEFPHAHYHCVKLLHEEPALDWEDASKLAPRLCKGWYELAQLPARDRPEFVRDFWCTKFNSHPEFVDFLIKFFSNVDDIGVFLVQQCYEDAFEPQLIYSLSDDSGFFHGNPPVHENEIITLQKEFPDYILPADYLDFLQIHNGFAKLTDTGIIKSSEMKNSYLELQAVLEKGEPLRTTSEKIVNPKSLIPFYKSFNTPFYQCFCGEWYPDQEMGNVYYSGMAHTISDFTQQGDSIDTMAFDTFTDWLLFYLEKID